MGGTVKSITSGITGGIKNEVQGALHGDVNQMASGWKQYAGSAARGGAAVATFGTSELANKAMGGRLFGGMGTNSYVPQQLSQQDPKLMLAQSGGAPLLTQIALGANVEDALAGYFGRSKGSDWDAYQKNLSPDEQAAINGVRTQLTQIQSNTDLRNKAVQKVVNDFPNVVSMTAPSVLQAKQAAGEEFDSASKSAMDYALNSTASKYNSGGMLSSGAAAEAEARVGAQYGAQKLGYQDQQGNKQLDLLGSQWQSQYNEANALRGFQNTVLGMGAGQGFSANQAALNRQQQTGEFNAGAANNAGMYNSQQSQQMYGAVGQLGGTLLGAAFGGPLGASVGGQVGKMATSSGSGSGFSGNPRLNLNRGY